jgi:phage terminase small subunit
VKLDKRGRAAWREIASAFAAVGILDAHNESRLADYCRALDLEDLAAADVAERGLTVQGARGLVANPSAKVLHDATLRAATLRRELEAVYDAKG